jgi:type I restriction enzyme S subunit
MSEVTLPKGWRATQLGEVVEYGKTQKCELSDITVDTWILELEDIEKNSSRIIQRLNTSERPFKSTKNKFKKGDVLYGKLRPYLNKVVIADDNGVCSTEIIPLNAEQNVNNHYLFHWLKSEAFLNYVVEVSYGVNMPRLGTKDGLLAPFVLPPLAEQKVIADKLDTLLTQVETTKARLDRIPQILKTFRQSVLAAAVSGKLTEEFVGKKRKLRDIVEFKQGTQVPSPEQVEEKVDGFDRFLRIINFTQGVKEFKYVPTKKSNRAILEDDVVMVRYGATSGFVGRGLAGVLANNLFVISPDEELLSKKYLYTYLVSPIFQNPMKQMVKGGAMPAISFKLFNDIEIVLPSLEIQSNTVKRVEELFAFADRIEQKNNAALDRVNNLTQSILAKAFRGELTADWREANSDLISDENSAKALLAMIKAEREALKNHPKKKIAVRKKA